jgi:chromosome segregation protein
VRAFAADAPPAKLAFYAAPGRHRQHAPDAAAPGDLLRLDDAGLKAC